MKTRKDVLRPIRRLVRKECASIHNSNKCHMCPGDQSICSFFREDGQYTEYLKKGIVRCVYFENHILPTDPKLELNYWGQNPAGTQGQTVGNCERCKTSFVRHSNRHAFCKECQGQISKSQARVRQRKKYWEDKTKNLTV